jgi:peptide deformylase
MPKDPVVQVGTAVLNEVAKPIAKKDIRSRKVASVIKRMKAVLKKEQFGVAIAAPQIGESLRIFIVAGRMLRSGAGKAFDERNAPSSAMSEEEALSAEDKVFINPEITRMSKAKKEMGEGCLSVRGKYGSVLRSEKATVKALDEEGKEFVHHGSGIMAQIFQHEMDHLEGILYTDKASTVVDEAQLHEADVKTTKN